MLPIEGNISTTNWVAKVDLIGMTLIIGIEETEISNWASPKMMISEIGEIVSTTVSIETEIRLTETQVLLAVEGLTEIPGVY